MSLCVCYYWQPCSNRGQRQSSIVRMVLVIYVCPSLDLIKCHSQSHLAVSFAVQSLQYYHVVSNTHSNLTVVCSIAHSQRWQLHQGSRYWTKEKASEIQILFILSSTIEKDFCMSQMAITDNWALIIFCYFRKYSTQNFNLSVDFLCSTEQMHVAADSTLI